MVKLSPVSTLQWPCPSRRQETQQMWIVRRFTRTSQIVSWSLERAWTTIRRMWPVRVEWRPCAGENNSACSTVLTGHLSSKHRICRFLFELTPLISPLSKSKSQLGWAGIKKTAKSTDLHHCAWNCLSVQFVWNKIEWNIIERDRYASSDQILEKMP